MLYVCMYEICLTLISYIILESDKYSVYMLKLHLIHMNQTKTMLIKKNRKFQHDKQAAVCWIMFI